MNTRTDEADHEQLADELEDRAEEMSKRTEELEDEIENVRGDWKAKRRDDGVVGGPPPREDE
ncbi:MAG TPA: hypothetical protein VMF07_02320 [Solirubrobacteraceae bacterium]|nr:hypothetical protein [Solirubrobacteraceae bacterium]